MLAPVQVKNNIPLSAVQQLPGKANIHAREFSGIEQLPGINERKGLDAAFGATPINNTAGSKHDFASISLRANIPVQAKLTVNTPGDEFEQEADLVAEKVMRMSGTDQIQTKISALPTIARQCDDCAKEKANDGEDQKEKETEPLEKIMLQRKCATCEDEENKNGAVQRKCVECEKKDEDEKKLQRKAKGQHRPAISNAVTQTLESSGSPLDKATRDFMEMRFGFDFGNVRLHDYSLAHQSARDINALAYTYQNNIVFAAGQYQPQTESGKKLLAHELTHVIQQKRAGSIQRKPGDVGKPLPAAVGATAEENIGILLSVYKTLPASIGNLEQVLTVSGTTGRLYDVKTTEKGFEKSLIATYTFRQLGIPPYFLITLPDSKFGILAVQDIEQSDGSLKINNTIIGLKRDTPEEKKIFAEIDKELSMPTWFVNEKDKTDFYKRVTKGGFAVVIYASAGGGAAGKGSDSEEVTPPMPKWMGPYKDEMQKLITAARAAEPYSTDMPDKFYLYYSKKLEHWRAGASQAIADSKKTLDVYLEITEKDVKKDKLQEMRDMIRIKQLSDPSSSSKDSIPLDPKLQWAYRLKLELDVLIAAAKKERPDGADLPDRTAIITSTDDPNIPLLKIYKYVLGNDPDGKLANTLRQGVLSSPLINGTDPKQLFELVKKATLALRGGEIKRVNENSKDYKTILDAFPGLIEGINTREDFRTVTGAKLDLHMKLNISAMPGMNLLGEAATIFRGILYTWDVYRISEVVPDEELKKMSADWKDRRKELQAWFKNSGQLQKANPALNEELKMELANTLKPEELNQYRNSGQSYGLATSYDSTGTVGMPKTEGEYVVYCRALVEPGTDVFRLPSEAFFTVKLIDGYKMADEIRDERLNEMSKLEKDIAGEKDIVDGKENEKKKKLKEKLDAIKEQEKRTLGTAADFNRSSQQNIVSLATKLTTYYTIAGGREVPDLIYDDYKNKKISDQDLDKLIDLWKYVETYDSSKKPVEQLADIIKSANKNIKQITEMKERVAMFDENLKGFTILPVPVVGIVSRVTGQPYPLLLTIGFKEEQGHTQVLLVDVTTHESQGKYEGESQLKKDEGGLAAAVLAAFKEFGKKCKYGEGYISYRVPGTDASDHVESAPGPLQQVKQILGIVAAVAGVTALIVGTVFTGGALAAVAGYVGVGAMVIGAGMAIDNIYDRGVNHRLHADVELAMDILNIAGPVLQGVGALTKLSKLSTLKTLVVAAEKVGEVSAAEKGVVTVAALAKLEKLVMLEKTLMIIQKGEAITNLGLVGIKTYQDLGMVAEVYGDDPAKVKVMQAEIIKNSIIAGTFALIALKNEFKMRNTEELEGLVNNLVKEKDYESAMIKSGIKDADGNWKDKKMKEYFLGKGKDAIKEINKPKVEEENLQQGNKPKAAGSEKEHVPDNYEKERKVQMKGHAETPDKQHDVESYPDGTLGRCSSVAGEKCPILQTQFKDVIAERPVLKKKIEDLTTEINAHGDNVPQAKMDELAALEQRMRNLELARKTSAAPKGYKIIEVEYNHDSDVSKLNNKGMLEYPNGERVWRGADNGTHHEGTVGKSIGRQGTENDFYTGTETGLPTMKGTERAHSFGQGFGWESPYGLLNAPRYVNQKLQNNGIEQYIRSLRDLLPGGQKIVLHTNTKSVPGTRRLQSVSYEGFIMTAAGEKIPAFSYTIDVAWKPAGGSVVDAAPIQFKTSSNPAHQKIITDAQALIPSSKMPEYIVKPIHQDITVK